MKCITAIWKTWSLRLKLWSRRTKNKRKRTIFSSKDSMIAKKKLVIIITSQEWKRKLRKWKNGIANLTITHMGSILIQNRNIKKKGKRKWDQQVVRKTFDFNPDSMILPLINKTRKLFNPKWFINLPLLSRTLLLNGVRKFKFNKVPGICQKSLPSNHKIIFCAEYSLIKAGSLLLAQKIRIFIFIPSAQVNLWVGFVVTELVSAVCQTTQSF